MAHFGKGWKCDGLDGINDQLLSNFGSPLISVLHFDNLCNQLEERESEIYSESEAVQRTPQTRICLTDTLESPNQLKC